MHENVKSIATHILICVYIQILIFKGGVKLVLAPNAPVN